MAVRSRSFTGATSEYLLGFASRWEGAEVIRLERNYRSAPPILALANRLMRGRPGALELKAEVVSDVRGDVGADARAGSDARLGRRIKAERGAEPQVVAHDTDADEARAVAAAVAAEIAAGTRPDRIAILYRVNAQAALFENALADLGIGARQQGATKFFDLPDVKRAILGLASLARQGVAPETPLWQSVSDVVRHVPSTSSPKVPPSPSELTKATLPSTVPRLMTQSVAGKLRSATQSSPSAERSSTDGARSGRSTPDGSVPTSTNRPSTASPTGCATRFLLASICERTKSSGRRCTRRSSGSGTCPIASG